MLCSSFGIKLVCVEFWCWTTLFRKKCSLSGPKVPNFTNVYKVKVKQQANQCFLKCDCLHYERCGIPCTHIMKITNEIDETMITVQHRKVYLVHFGLPDSWLSDQLMKAVSMQILHEDLGLVGFVGCWRRQFWCDMTRVTTCRWHVGKCWPDTSAIFLHFWPRQCRVVFVCCWHVSVSSEVPSKMIFMGHQLSSCHVPVVRSFLIFWKMLLSSWKRPYDHLPMYTNIIFQYPKKWPRFDP